MSNIQVSLDRIGKDDIYSLAISLLYTLKDDPKYSIVSELPYILDYNNFTRFIKYYGGQIIRIPTIEEIGDLIRVIQLYQYKNIDKMTWEEALVKAGFSLEESNSARVKLINLVKIIDSQEIGGRHYD